MISKLDDMLYKTTVQRLEDLVAGCTGPDGKPKAPSVETLNRAREVLPHRSKYSLSKQRTDP